MKDNYCVGFAMASLEVIWEFDKRLAILCFLPFFGLISSHFAQHFFFMPIYRITSLLFFLLATPCFFTVFELTADCFVMPIYRIVTGRFVTAT